MNLLKELQDVFVIYFKNLKGMVKDMGEMKIELLPDSRPVKKRLYKLGHKYKDIDNKEIDNMLKACII